MSREWNGLCYSGMELGNSFRIDSLQANVLKNSVAHLLLQGNLYVYRPSEKFAEYFV